MKVKTTVSYTHLDVYKRQSSLYLDMNEALPDVSKLEDEVAALKKKYADTRCV